MSNVIKTFPQLTYISDRIFSAQTLPIKANFYPRQAAAKVNFKFLTECPDSLNNVRLEGSQFARGDKNFRKDLELTIWASTLVFVSLDVLSSTELS